MVLRKRIPWVSGKCFLRPRSSSSGSDVLPPRCEASDPVGACWAYSTSRSVRSASATEDLLAVVARGLAAGQDGAQRRHVDGALLARPGCRAEAPVGAARVERAAARDARQVRRLPGDRLQPAA